MEPAREGELNGPHGSRQFTPGATQEQVILRAHQAEGMDLDGNTRKSWRRSNSVRREIERFMTW